MNRPFPIVKLQRSTVVGLVLSHHNSPKHSQSVYDPMATHALMPEQRRCLHKDEVNDTRSPEPTQIHMMTIRRNAKLRILFNFIGPCLSITPPMQKKPGFITLLRHLN